MTTKKKTRAERELAKIIKVTQRKVAPKHKSTEDTESEKKNPRFYDSSLLHDKSVEDSTADEIFQEMKRRDF
jgi:hypothetical protein